MKRVIGILFGVACLVAALQPAIARAGDKWAFMVLFYQFDEIVDSKIIGADTKDKCVEFRKGALKKLAEHYAATDVFYAISDCAPVVIVAKQKLKKERDS